MRYTDEKPSDLGKKVKFAFFITNVARLLVYWTIFYAAMIPFFGLSWKTLAAGFVLGFFAALINQLRMDIAQSKPMDMSQMIGGKPPLTDKDMEVLGAIFRDFGK